MTWCKKYVRLDFTAKLIILEQTKNSLKQYDSHCMLKFSTQKQTVSKKGQDDKRNDLSSIYADDTHNYVCTVSAEKHDAVRTQIKLKW